MNALPLPSDVTEIRLPDGCCARLRLVLPTDAAAECEFVAGLSACSRFNRFHGTVNGLTDAMARHLTCVDQARHVALVATVTEGGRETVIADARYVARGDSAEFAIAVSDRFQRCGIARRLVQALAFCARRAGLRWLVGEVLATNRRMLSLAARLGFAQARAGEGVVRVERPLEPSGAAQPGVAGRALEHVRAWLFVGCASTSREMFDQFL